MAVDLRYASKESSKTIQSLRVEVRVIRKRQVVDPHQSDEKVRIQLRKLELQPREDVRYFETPLTESKDLNGLSGKLRPLLEFLLKQSPPGVLRFLLRTLDR